MVLVLLAIVGLCSNRDLRTRSGLVLVPRITRAKWFVIIINTLLVVVAMPLLGAAAGIDAAVVERIFSNEHLWQEDRSALMDPTLWDRIGLDRQVARNLLRVYQLSESIETVVYAFVAHVAAMDPRDW